MFCPQCGTQYSASKRFCPQCRTPNRDYVEFADDTQEDLYSTENNDRRENTRGVVMRLRVLGFLKRVTLALPFIIACALPSYSFTTSIPALTDVLKVFDPPTPARGTLVFFLGFVLMLAPALGIVPIIRGALRGSLQNSDLVALRLTCILGIANCLSLVILTRVGQVTQTDEALQAILGVLEHTYQAFAVAEVIVLILELLFLTLYRHLWADDGELPTRGQRKIARMNGGEIPAPLRVRGNGFLITLLALLLLVTVSASIILGYRWSRPQQKVPDMVEEIYVDKSFLR